MVISVERVVEKKKVCKSSAHSEIGFLERLEIGLVVIPLTIELA